MRVAVTSFGEAFRAETPEELSERAKVLARSLGVTRELDVFAADMLPPVEEAMPNLAGLGVLKLALEDVRARAWTDAVALVRSPLFGDFLRNIEDYGESRAWRDRAGAERRAGFIEPAVERGCDTLDARLEKADKRAKHLDELDEKERHKLRIALKKLRYCAEFYAPLFKAKRVVKFVDRLAELQDAFGDMNDAATVGGVIHHIIEQRARIRSTARPARGGVVRARLAPRARRAHLEEGAQALARVPGRQRRSGGINRCACAGRDLALHKWPRSFLRYAKTRPTAALPRRHWAMTFSRKARRWTSCAQMCATPCNAISATARRAPYPPSSDCTRPGRSVCHVKLPRTSAVTPSCGRFALLAIKG